MKSKLFYNVIFTIMLIAGLTSLGLVVFACRYVFYEVLQSPPDELIFITYSIVMCLLSFASGGIWSHPRKRWTMESFIYMLNSEMDVDALMTALRRHCYRNGWTIPGEPIIRLEDVSKLLISEENIAAVEAIIKKVKERKK